MKIVVDKNIPLAEEAFRTFGDVVGLKTVDITVESVRDTDILIVRSETKVNRSLLDGSNVRFVGTATIGTDHIDIEYLQSKGIAFASAPGCNSNSVKEYIVAALLQLATKHKISLKGKTIGVVGVGNVGSKVVQAARVLGMNVLQNDPPRARKEPGSIFLPLDELMGVDVLTVHTPLTRMGDDPTFHLFDSNRMNNLKPGLIFVNSSRGAVVDTQALKSAIQERRISSTVLDVWENEPVIDTSLFPFVTIGTPHIAGYSYEGKINGTMMIREAISEYLKIDSPWEPRIHIESIADTIIQIPHKLSSFEDVVHYAVSRCYDIAYDDELLRGIASQSASEQGKYFRGLRSGYRVRREFSNYTIELFNNQTQYLEVLVALGFHCRVIN